MTRAIRWRCFHCNEAFTRAQEKHARLHFGADESATPVCLMRVPGEHDLVSALRRAEQEIDSRREDIDPLLNALCSMRADHDREVRAAEARGYNQGVAAIRFFHLGQQAAVPVVPHPKNQGRLFPAHVVLSDLAAQENCDGEPYDTMQNVADALRQRASGQPAAVPREPTSAMIKAVRRGSPATVALLGRWWRSSVFAIWRQMYDAATTPPAPGAKT